jgi:sigma-54 specific flagellar transcriptional regulator A
MAETWQALKAERAHLDAREVGLIMQALESSNGVIAHAARKLGIARTTLASRLDVLGVRPRLRANS